MGSKPEQQQGFDPEEYPGERSTGSKQNGNDAEQWVRDHYDLDPQDPDICPESSHDAVDPRTGTPIEIKSCQIYYNGNGSRGRFQIWDYAHQDLIEAGGAYIFVVHEPRTDQFEVYLHRPLSAEEVDALIGNWHPIDHSLRPDEAHRTELCQSAVFTDIQVSRITPSTNDTETDADSGTDQKPPQVERMKAAKEAVETIEEQHDEQMAPHGAVVQQAVEESGATPDQIEHQLEELKKRGEIYMPREGAYRAT
jgi:hypothetical protein